VTIRIEEPSDGVRLLTIDRPERRNAIDLATYRALTAAIDDADHDPDVRCCVLTGAGNVFTSGNDLGDFQQPQGPGPCEAFRFVRTLVGAGKPLVAAVEGFAVGIGATMLLHFDLAFAGRSAQFRLPFVDLGLCPEAGSSYLLPQVAGLRRASELLMLSKKFGAEDAAEAGLINGVVDDGAALDTALARARAGRRARRIGAAGENASAATTSRGRPASHRCRGDALHRASSLRGCTGRVQPLLRCQMTDGPSRPSAPTKPLVPFGETRGRFGQR
jgi:enoyl-CoA hydratase/carnithine racemase